MLLHRVTSVRSDSVASGVEHAFSDRKNLYGEGITSSAKYVCAMTRGALSRQIITAKGLDVNNAITTHAKLHANPKSVE